MKVPYKASFLQKRFETQEQMEALGCTIPLVTWSKNTSRLRGDEVYSGRIFRETLIRICVNYSLILMETLCQLLEILQSCNCIIKSKVMYFQA